MSLSRSRTVPYKKSKDLGDGSKNKSIYRYYVVDTKNFSMAIRNKKYSRN
jgi:hypothetical protein